jgi:uncharacterized protein (DUF2252 family)
VRSAVERIRAFNRGRLPDALERKYGAMAAGAFSFFRGTCHLFWDDWPKNGPLDVAPLAWSTGDLHLENFGAYKGDRLEYFDINDFDEAALAPCTGDAARFTCSVLVAADDEKLSPREAAAVCRKFLERYVDALRAGRPGWIERELAEGQIRKLLGRVEGRTRAALLARHTEMRRSGARKIRLDPDRAWPVSAKERAWATRLVRLAARKSERERFRVVDVARRIAGTGSLGLERYVVLVEGKGSPDGNRLLDLKAARKSVVPAGRRSRIPWSCDAERVFWAQTHMQAASPALLRPVNAGSRSYILRELQPREDRLRLRKLSPGDLEQAAGCMGSLLAWAQLRASGQKRAAPAEALVDFAGTARWGPLLLGYAEAYARVVRRDYQEFRRARKAGCFDQVRRRRSSKPC